MSEAISPAPGFVLTPELIQQVRTASLTGASLALILSFLVCLTSVWIYAVPSARHHLDRVSFRLLLWSMVSEVLFTICFLLLTRDADLIYSQTGCGGAVYLTLATMGMCNWLCTCIGINLMLAISFGINPIQSRLERWYILGSFVMGFGVPLVPAALGHFGVDPEYQACYFTQGDKMLRVRDLVMDLYLWQLLSALVAAASVASVLFTLLRRSKATQRALFNNNNLSVTASELREITNSAISSSTFQSAIETKWYHRLLPTRAHGRRRSQMHRLEDKLAGIALKISLYPLALIIINVIITAEDLSYNARGGLFSMNDYNLYLVHNLLYGGRGIFFALLGIFVDPCLRLGVPAAFRATFLRNQGREPISGEDRSKGGASEGAQSIVDFLEHDGPESYAATEVRDTPTSKRGKWCLLGSRRGRGEEIALDEETSVQTSEKELVLVDDNTKVERNSMDARHSLAELRSDSPTPGVSGSPHHSRASTPRQIFTVTIDSPAQYLPVRFSPSDSTLPSSQGSPGRRQSLANAHISNLTPRTVDPNVTISERSRLSSDVSNQRPPLIPRHSSDPEMSAARRRRRELQVAAEEMYAKAQMGL